MELHLLASGVFRWGRVRWLELVFDAIISVVIP
jgi:hypothetical protein